MADYEQTVRRSPASSVSSGARLMPTSGSPASMVPTVYTTYLVSRPKIIAIFLLYVSVLFFTVLTKKNPTVNPPFFCLLKLSVF